MEENPSPENTPDKHHHDLRGFGALEPNLERIIRNEETFLVSQEVEHGRIIHPSTGQIVERFQAKSETPNILNFPIEIAENMIATHNHRDSRSLSIAEKHLLTFSLDDISTAVYANVREMRVVTYDHDGKILHFIARRRAVNWSFNVEDTITLYNQGWKARSSPIENALRSNGIDLNTALQRYIEEAHQTWVRVADELGFDYLRRKR